MIQFLKNLKYKKSTLTNLLYLVTASFHFFVWNLFTGCAFTILAVSSFMFHYYTALYHEHLANESDWNRKYLKKMKQWQYADVSSIYLLFGFYPYELSGNPWWLLFLIPMSFLIFNKFNVLLPNWSPSTSIAVLLSAIPMTILGFIYLPLSSMLMGILFIALAWMFSKEAEELVDQNHFDGYDQKHGFWHKFAAIAFIFIK